MGIKRKKGQFGLMDVFSYMMYFLVVLIVIFLLNFYGCVNKNSRLQNNEIREDVSLANSVRADLQLDSMLRTKISADELNVRLYWMKNYREQDFAAAFRINFDNVKDFLEAHNEIINDTDYSGFIARLQPFYDAEVAASRGRAVGITDAEKVFRAVTAALFMRSVNGSVRRGAIIESITWFYLPGISVDFSPKYMTPNVGIYECNLRGRVDNDGRPVNDDPYDMCAENLDDVRFRNALPSQLLTHVIQQIPLADGRVTRVGFGYYPETISMMPRP